MALACYTPTYLPASFKGVGFVAEEVSSEHGRRGAEGEFPFGENTGYVDLGRKIRRYSLKGRLMENSHVADAAALIAACESYGPGLLVHPTRGAFLAACTKLTVSDDPLNGQGITNVDLEFVEANAVATGALFSSALFSLSTAPVFAALSGLMDQDYDIDNVRYYRVKDVQDAAAASIDAIRAEFAKVIAQTNENSKWTALSVMESFVNDPSQLTTARETFNAIKRSATTLANNATGRRKYNAFKTIANKMALTSALPEEAGLAQDAVYLTTRVIAAMNMARASLEIQVDNLSDALDQYDEIVEILNQEMRAARNQCNDDVHLQIYNFLSDAKKALLDKAYSLSALVTYHFNKSVSSLEAAYDIFDDAKRFAEIETRNPFIFPWLIGPDVLASAPNGR